MLSQSKLRAIFLFSLIAVVCVVSFTDALSQWQFNQDFKVSDNYVGLGESWGPRVAMSNSGNSVIVWVEDYHELYYQLMDQNNYHVGISVLVNANAIPGGYSINVGMNSTGDFSVVWANRQTSDLFLKRFESNGHPLGAEIKVNENGIVNEYDFPLDYAMNDDGRSVVVWENNNDGYKNIYGQYYNSDGTLSGNNFQVTDDPSSAENAPTVAIDGQGNFVVVWIDSTGGNSKLYGKRYNSSCNSLGTKFLIDECDEFSRYDDFPSISMNDQGYFLVCWHKKDQTGQTNLCGLMFDPQGDKIGVQYQVDNIPYDDRIDAVLFNDNSSILVWGAAKYQRFASDGSLIDGTETANVEPYYVSSACIAGNDEKNYNMVWFSTIYTVNRSYFIYSQQFFSDGKRNGPNILIGRKIVSDVAQYRPALACNNSGKFVITWNDKRNEKDWGDVYAQILGSNGKFFRDNFAVIIKGYSDCDPGIALRDDGSFIVLWKDDAKCAPDEEFNLYAKWYNPDGIPSEKFKVNDFECSVYFYMPKVEISPTGGFIIVWTDQRDSWKNGKIRCQMYDANSNPIGANFEVNDPVDRQIKCQKPSFEIDASGNFIMVWETDLNGNLDIYGKIFNSDGIPYQANFMINDDGGSSDQGSPAVAMHSDGSFVVTWSDGRNGNSDIFAQRYDSNWNPTGNNFLVNDGGLTSSQSNPAIAFKPDGKFVIAWQDYRNGNDDIYAQKFNADGSKKGGNYQVNDDDGAAIQRYPQVDCNSENIYFAWQDNRIRNEDYDIFARVEPFSGVQHLIVIQQPDAGDKWIIGEPNRITWNSSDLGGTLTVELSSDNGYTWKTISSNTPFDAAYVEYTPAAEISDHCFIKITSNDFPTVSDLSDRFNIFKPVKRYTAKQFSITTDPITLDGLLTEGAWNDAKTDSLLFGGDPEEWTSQWTNFSDHLVSWKALWSPENNRVHLAFEIQDNIRGTLDNNDANEIPFYPFNDESIELYVDGD